MTLRLRSARLKDAPELGEILHDWVESTPWVPQVHGLDDLQELAQRMIREMTVKVVVDDGVALGFLARRDGFVHALYIAPAARGQGIGQRLISDAKREAGPLTLWTFQANVAARAFYAREGFKEVARSNGAGNDEGLPDVRLEWAGGAHVRRRRKAPRDIWGLLREWIRV